MSREVRRVPLDWQHPKSLDVPWSRGVPVHVPLFPRDDYPDHAKEWEDMDPDEQDEMDRPDLDTQYMPDFSDTPEDQLGWCMYETTSEGTPKTPVFATPEELAAYCADPQNGVTAWSHFTADYDQWMETIRRGSAVGGVWSPKHGMISGVQATTMLDKKEDR